MNSVNQAKNRDLAIVVNALASARQHGAAGFLPGVDAAGDMGGVGKAGLLGGGHRHRRALAEGTEEHDASTGRSRHLAQHAARTKAFADARIGSIGFFTTP